MNTVSGASSAVLKSRSPSLGEVGLPFVILLIIIVTSVIEPRFWSWANLQNLLRQMATLQILAIGQLFAVLSGGLDLSVAAVMALAGVCGILVTPEFGLFGALVTMLVIGVGAGLMTGTIVVAFRVSPLIVTLGMMSVAKGVALVLAGGLPLYGVPDALVDYGVENSETEQLSALLRSYKSRMNEKGVGFDEQQAARETLTSLFRKTSLLLESIDKMMRRFKTKEPEFYSTYDAAREIIDKATAKKEPLPENEGAAAN